jgi:hypothetical protein
MKVSKNSISVWPGYVAAISCLVLSLLLLSAIIVSVITQIGMIAAAYRNELRSSAIRSSIRRNDVQRDPLTGNDPLFFHNLGVGNMSEKYDPTRMTYPVQRTFWTAACGLVQRMTASMTHGLTQLQKATP